MAHAIFAAEARKRGMPVEVYSAGVLDFRGQPAIADTTRTCERHNTPAPSDVASWVGDLPIESITRFLVMEQYHADALIETYAVPAERVSLLGEFDPLQRDVEIADPFSYSSAVYEECYEQIRDCIVNYLDTTNELAA
jgi:protein-tyrosine-phosphatase